MAFNDSTLSLASFGGSRETRSIWTYTTSPNAFQDPANNPLERNADGDLVQNRTFLPDIQGPTVADTVNVLDKDYFGNETKIQTGDLMYIDAPLVSDSDVVVQRYYRCVRSASGYIRLQGSVAGTTLATTFFGVGRTGAASTE